ncbi:carbohydrate-binding protein [candidate division WWE3 bacterium]|nr:carbohydrate-binding protein [candidate division WWE3 bacterium]
MIEKTSKQLITFMTIVSSFMIVALSLLFIDSYGSKTASDNRKSASAAQNTGNYVLYTQTDIDNIKAQINSNTTIKNAYNDLITKANEDLNGSFHFYGGTSHTANSQASRAALRLALAYRLTGDTQYASKAKSVVMTVTSASTMVTDDPSIPDKATASDSLLLYGVDTPGMILAADFLDTYPGFNSSEKQSVKDWFNATARSAMTLHYNTKVQAEAGREYMDLGFTNYNSWRVVLIMTAGIYTKDSELFNFAVSYFKNSLMEEMFNSLGVAVWEVRRITTKTYYYSHYTISGMLQLIILARKQGVDLASYKNSAGANLKTVLDYYYQFANGTPWPYEGIEGSNPPKYSDVWENFEAGYFMYKDSRYNTLINSYRPTYWRSGIMTPNTLFFLSSDFNNPSNPITPNPTTTGAPTATPIPVPTGRINPSPRLPISPYNSTGTPWAIPGTIEAESFDNGGVGIAYYDTDSDNIGGAYRSTSIDIDPYSNGNYSVAWIRPTEWLRYSVFVQTRGIYDIKPRVAFKGPAGNFDIEIDGKVVGSFTIPDTKEFSAFTDITVGNIQLETGYHVLRIIAVSANEGSYDGLMGDIDKFTFVLTKNLSTSPNTQSPAAVPGKIEAENFDRGGEGIAYHDTKTGNELVIQNKGGIDYRPGEGVDIGKNANGATYVGWIENTEWLVYTINVTEDGYYHLSAQAGFNGAGGSFDLEIDGKTQGHFTIRDLGAWDIYTTIPAWPPYIRLTKGTHTLRLIAKQRPGVSTYQNLLGDIDYFEISK